MSDKNDDKNNLLYCSFCGKSQHEVKKLIAGPSVYICNECVDLCDDIIKEEIADLDSILQSDDDPNKKLPIGKQSFIRKHPW